MMDSSRMGCLMVVAKWRLLKDGLTVDHLSRASLQVRESLHGLEMEVTILRGSSVKERCLEMGLTTWLMVDCMKMGSFIQTEMTETLTSTLYLMEKLSSLGNQLVVLRVPRERDSMENNLMLHISRRDHYMIKCMIMLSLYV